MRELGSRTCSGGARVTPGLNARGYIHSYVEPVLWVPKPWIRVWVRVRVSVGVRVRVRARARARARVRVKVAVKVWVRVSFYVSQSLGLGFEHGLRYCSECCSPTLIHA